MALIKGSRKVYDWLKNQKKGTVVARQDILAVTGWAELTLDTYINKNKLAPFLVPVGESELEVQMDGSGISEDFFDEVFSQKRTE